MSVDRWLVNTLPLWLLGLTLVGGLGAIAVAGAAMVRRRVSAVAEGDYAEMAKTMLAHLLAVYSLVLAFVVVNENQGYTQARIDVQTEALNVEDFYRSTREFAEPAAQGAHRHDAGLRAHGRHTRSGTVSPTGPRAQGHRPTSTECTSS